MRFMFSFDCFQEKKLVLIVDLNGTLIHSTYKPSKKQAQEASCETVQVKNFPSNKKCYVSVRPGAEKFLHLASQFYHIYVCTEGGKDYSKAMIRLLDPHGEIFQGVIACDTKAEWGSKADQVEKICDDESLVCIMDDIKCSWPVRHNVLGVKRYTHFMDDGTIHTDKHEDQYLLNVASALEKIHSEFFLSYELEGRFLGHKFLLKNIFKTVVSDAKVSAEHFPHYSYFPKMQESSVEGCILM